MPVPPPPTPDWSAVLASPAQLFFLFAGLAGLVMVFLVLGRNGRREVAWVLAALFAVNGAGALLSLLDAGGPAYHGLSGDISTYFDEWAFVVLLYLALCFPRRPAWLERHRWVLPVCAVGLALLLAVVHALRVPGTDHPRTTNITLTPARVAIGYLLPAVAWGTLALRWSWLWPQALPYSVRAAFKFIFGAIGIRAASQLVTSALVAVSSQSPAALVTMAQALNLAVLLAYVAGVGLLARAALRQKGTRRTETVALASVFLASSLLGLVTSPLVDRLAYFSPLANADLFILRPLAVWYAMVGHGFLRRGRFPWVGSWLLLSLLGSALACQLLGNFAFSPVVLGIGVALAVLGATAILVAAGPKLIARSEGSEAVARYRRALRDAGGDPSAATHLEDLRNWLGIPLAQHDALLAESAAGPAAAAGGWRAGRMVAGRYRIEHRLGEGAMGTTYRARDLETDRDVVVKRANGLEPEERDAVLHEAEVLAGLHHPNIVRLVDSQVDAQEPILVLEHLPRSLRERMADGALPPGEAVAIADGVLDALSAIHGAGIVHGDVKPENILLAADGSPRLADFGIARRPVPRWGNMTQRAGPRGSSRYMAPEQERGHHADVRADLYATAVVLHEMLAGGHPADGVPLPTGLAPALAAAVRKGMAQQAARRHASAAAFRQALARAAPGTPASSVRRR